MTRSLPICSSASFVARIEPRASPSGFSWVARRNRSCERIASATASMSLVVWCELIDQLRHADPALDRTIVFERELRRPLQPQLPRQPRLEDAVSRLEPGKRPRLGILRAEDADENARLAEVRRGLDAGDGDEADSRVLQLPDGLRQHFTDGCVDAAHAVAHGRIQSSCAAGARKSRSRRASGADVCGTGR